MPDKRIIVNLFTMKQLVALLFLLFCSLFHQLFAQSATGTWQGTFNGQMIVVSIEQKDTMLCGFTHDYIIEDSLDNCTAAYAGSYHRRQKLYVLHGNRFIKNSGTHSLMFIILRQDASYGKNYLVGKIFTGSIIFRMLGIGGSDILLEKISSRPIKLWNGEPNCFPKPKSIPKSKPIPTPAKPKVPKPASKPPIPKPEKIPVPKPDTPKKMQPEIFTTKKPDAEILKDMEKRKQGEMSRLEVSVKQINLKVYDNGVVDNDTVSIFYNGKLLLSHQRLSETPIIINLDLENDVTEHKITMYAENLGGIPPNTALIVVTAGDKRYELRSKASLEENAVLIFDYRPK